MASIVNVVKINSGLANRYFIAGNAREGPVAGHEETANGHGFGHRFGESRVFMELDSLELNEEADGVVLEREEAGLSGSPMDAHGSEVVIGSGINSESHTAGSFSSSVDALAEFSVAEIKVWEYDNLSDAAGSCDGVRDLHGIVGNWRNRFEVGDMVWGKVKSHPWWPGQIFSEAFALSSVRRTKRDGHLLVAFFGDSSYGWFDPSELIPFDPYYEEKSKQTTLRPFVNAVEEATDERSRREALALTCYCRNKFNFRPARVLSYFHVDVPGFERGGIYSSNQIEEARNKFVPDQVLSYVKQMAACPLADDLSAINLVKKLEMLVAYRRAVFEEFDETYAQAFGVEPVGSSSLTRAVSDHPERFSPRAPLSGQLVIPEHRRHPRRSSHALLPHKLSSAKDKYVLKRRDPQLLFSGATVTSSSKLTPLDFPSPIQPFSSFHNIFPIAPQPLPPRPTTAGQDASASGDYVLQKRPPADFADDKPPRQVSPAPLAKVRVSEQKPSPSAVDVPVATAPRTDPPVLGAVADAKDGAALARPSDAWKPGGVVVSWGIPTKKKIKKRPREDGGVSMLDAAGEIVQKKKESKERSNDGKSASTFVSVGPEQPKLAEPFPSAPRPRQVSDLVGNLRELALDPYYGSDRDVPAAVLHAFLKFRSLVYKKSFVLPSPAEAEAAKVQPAKPPRLLPEAIAESSKIAPAKPAKVGKVPPVVTKPPKPGFRSNDPSIAGRKRTASDRLEEMNVKKQKKMDMVKTLVGEKKAVISQKGPVGQKEAGTSSTVVAASLSTTSPPAASAKPCNAKAAEPVKNPELRLSSPTALVMKFPPQTTLPSIATLKARFARFGPLELSSFRVYWQSYTCKVVYKFKPDAEAALQYARENKMFGQLKVYFHLRDSDTQAPEPFAEAGWQTQESRPVEGAQLGPGNSASSRITSSRPLINSNQKPSGRLKSILKKPGEDAAPSSGREAARVKFMLDNVNGKPERPPSPPPELVISKTTEPPTNPPPPLPSRPLFRTIDTASFPPPPPLAAPLQRLANNRVVPPPPFSHGSAEGRTIVNKDLAKQMVSLMVRCSEIVNSVKSLPGYAPYRPL
ncbi:hypothetical protein ZIOFF_001186 [Zingiber officinale]|uniref:PWWP domain-containing protein n=1 Tax=Zingiber officinale TaxID=94328 RepID=A0A8J5HYA8_ZINOF|nr:hypothetical protein ZIOFF_001186 [Zingiber officinale]